MASFPCSMFKSFSYQQPTKIVFGIGSIERLPDELRKLKFGSVMLVTGRVVGQTKAAERVREIVSQFGRLSEFNGVMPEPDTRVLNSLADQVRGNRPDVIIGLGGGSALDMAKAASAVAANEGDPLAYFRGEPLRNRGPPIITIPSLSGTGAEVTAFSVVAVGTDKLALLNPLLSPSLTVVDPSISVTADPGATASAGLDAMGHALEALMSTDSNAITDSLALEAVILLERYLERAYCNGDDIEAKCGLALASLASGMAFSNTGLGMAHGLAYTYALRCSLPHGASVALAEPYSVLFNAPAVPDKIRMMADAFGIEAAAASTPKEIGAEISVRLFEMMDTLRMPQSLRGRGVKEEDIPAMTDALLTKYSRFLLKNPRKPSRDDLTEIYEAMLEGAGEFS